MRPLHPVLQPDRGRPDDRADRAGRTAAGRHRRGRPVRVVLLRQHHPDLPGRRAHLGGLPIPLPPLRPRLLPVGVRALLRRLRHPHRPPARQGHAAPRRRRPRGQRGVDLRQGTLRVPLRAAQRPPRHPAGPQRRRRPGARLVAGGAGGGRARAQRRPLPGRRPRRRPADRRGRLRVQQVRARGARHERHRLPRARAQRRGSRLPGVPRGRPRPGPRRYGGHVHLFGEGSGRAAGRLRVGGGGARRLSAAAQGLAQARAAGVRTGHTLDPGPAEGGRHPVCRPRRAPRPSGWTPSPAASVWRSPAPGPPRHCAPRARSVSYTHL